MNMNFARNVARQALRLAKQPQCIYISSSRQYCQAENVERRIETLVKEQDVVVFMKGVPEAPKCGFSNAVVQILNFHGLQHKENKIQKKAVYEAHDVLADEELRDGIKKYSDWPTIPQIYFKGEFVGGCDIMLDMHKNGELIEELKKLGITSALLKGSDDDSS